MLSSSRLATPLEKTIYRLTVACTDAFQPSCAKLPLSLAGSGDGGGRAMAGSAVTETMEGGRQSASSVLRFIFGTGPCRGTTKVSSSMLRVSRLPGRTSSGPSTSKYTMLPPLCRGPVRLVALSTAASPSRVGWKSAAVGAEPSNPTTGSGKTRCTPPSAQLDCKVGPHKSDRKKGGGKGGELGGVGGRGGAGNAGGCGEQGEGGGGCKGGGGGG